MKTDKALQTARDLVDTAVCECGHFDSEHKTTAHMGVDDHCGECDCKSFRPVAFIVERAK